MEKLESVPDTREQQENYIRDLYGIPGWPQFNGEGLQMIEATISDPGFAAFTDVAIETLCRKQLVADWAAAREFEDRARKEARYA